jgi:hypothetical protein
MKRTTRVPSTAKRERVRVRVCDSVYQGLYSSIEEPACRGDLFASTESQALTLALSRFAVEGTCFSCPRERNP